MHKTQGIILASEKIAEADQFFYIFTQDFGKIACVAQGVRKNDSRLKSILQTGARIHFNFIALRSGRFRLASPSLVALYPYGEHRDAGLAVYLKSLALINKIVLENQSDEKLWNFLASWSGAFSALADFSAYNQERAYFWFLGNLLTVLGHMPQKTATIFIKELNLFISEKNTANFAEIIGQKYKTEFNIPAL